MRVLLLALGLTACGGPLADAEASFKKGRYPLANQQLLELQEQSRSWSDEKRAEFALYQGLTLMAPGDRGCARGWLREAKTVEDAAIAASLSTSASGRRLVDEPRGVLSYEDARRLAAAIAANDAP